MPAVKFVHILKRVQMIDRDIEELHKMGDELPNGRSYRNTLKIAAETEINKLLNERVKLMDLKIENPPENIMALISEPDAEPEPASPLRFNDYEEIYLAGKASTVQAAAPRPQIRIVTDGESVREGAAVTREVPEPRRSRREPEAPFRPRSREEILNDLPPLQY